MTDVEEHDCSRGGRGRWLKLLAPLLLLMVGIAAAVVLAIPNSHHRPSGEGSVRHVSAPPVPQESDAQVCAGRWHVEASQIDRQIASGFSPQGDYAAAGFSASAPTA